MCISFITPTESPTVAVASPAATVRCRTPTTSGSAADAPSASQHQLLLARNLALLLDVACSRRWNAFEAIALSNAGVFCSICDAYRFLNDRTTATTLLHAVLRHDPPARIVAKMIAALPTEGGGGRDDNALLLHARDSMGRTPLHVMCEEAAAARNNGGSDCCDPLAIKILANACPSACAALDDHGRTPLHLLAASSSSSCFDGSGDEPDTNIITNDDADGPCKRSLFSRMCALLSESMDATALLLEDDDGMTPLELAIVSDAPMEVVELLQKATQKATMMEIESSSKKTNKETNGRRSNNDKRRRSTMDDDDAASEIRRAGSAKRPLLDGTSTQGMV